MLQSTDEVLLFQVKLPSNQTLEISGQEDKFLEYSWDQLPVGKEKKQDWAEGGVSQKGHDHRDPKLEWHLRAEPSRSSDQALTPLHGPIIRCRPPHTKAMTLVRRLSSMSSNDSSGGLIGSSCQLDNLQTASRVPLSSFQKGFGVAPHSIWDNQLWSRGEGRSL